MKSNMKSQFFGRPIQIAIIIIWLLVIISAILVKINIQDVALLVLGRTLNSPEKWSSLISLAIAAYTLLSVFLYFIFTFFDISGLFKKLYGDKLGRLFIVATIILVICGFGYDLTNLIFDLDNSYFLGFIVSLYSNFCLYLLFAAVFRKCKIKFTKSEIVITAIAAITMGSLLIYSTLTRHYLYFWDYTTYYSNTLDCFETFDKGFIWGLAKVWWSSNWDYSWFINLFSMFFFSFTTLSNNAFCASLSFSILLPFVISLSAFIVKIMNVFSLKGFPRIISLFVSLLLVACQPQLYFTIYHSMPDMFGLVFALLLGCCLVDYDFSKSDYERWFYIWFSTIALIFTRRWYAFYVVSFWGIYALSFFVRSISRKEKAKIRNLIIFAIISIVLAVVFLSPMVIKVLNKSYVTDYASWKSDTLGQNIITYFKHCGYLMVSISILSYIIILIKRKLNEYDISNFICLILPLCLFHIIQSADYHQLLILAPSMIIGTILLPILIFNFGFSALGYGSSICLILISILNMTNAHKENDKLFLPHLSDATLVLPYRSDYEMIDVVNEWIIDNSNKYGDVYMIPHNGMYCPDIFRKKHLPNTAVLDLLPYGADVVSAHFFPIEILSSKFVLTAEPLGQGGNSIAPRIDSVVHELIDEGYYSLVETFDMQNGYQLLAYKRIKDADEYERSLYIEYFSDLIEQYPENYRALVSYTF